jgi:hypothetical protein
MHYISLEFYFIAFFEYTFNFLTYECSFFLIFNFIFFYILDILYLAKSKMSISKLNNIDEEQSQPLNIDEKKPPINRKSIKRKIIKDLIVFSISFLLCFSSTNGISNLQSALNGKMGVLALSVSSGAFLVVCLFLPPILNKYFNYKWPIIGSQICLALFTAANLYPRYWTLLPISLLTGASNSVLWTFQGNIYYFKIKQTSCMFLY